MFEYFSLSSYKIFRRVCSGFMYRAIFSKRPSGNGQIKIGSKSYSFADQLSPEQAEKIKINKPKKIFGKNTMVKKMAVCAEAHDFLNKLWRKI
jgi:hypothetical protein